MTDKVQKIREEVERMHNLLPIMDGDNISVNYADRICTTLEMYIDSLQEEPVSEELEKAAVEWFNSVKYKSDLSGTPINAFKAGAQWKKEHLWKPADGDDLPEYDREVIVLVKYSTQRNIHDKEYPTYRVGFGHRPNPNGWDGKSITTGNVEHYTPKLYDKGGWNAPDIAYWLDVRLPKEIEL